jgi:hypothetical protein
MRPIEASNRHPNQARRSATGVRWSTAVELVRSRREAWSEPSLTASLVEIASFSLVMIAFLIGLGMVFNAVRSAQPAVSHLMGPADAILTSLGDA